MVFYITMQASFTAYLHFQVVLLLMIYSKEVLLMHYFSRW